MIEIEGFINIIWKPGQREAWGPKFRRISLAYNRAEYETVKRGMRQACTIHIDMGNLQQYMDELSKDGLVFTPIARSGIYQGFAHKHAPVVEGKPSYWFGCVTRTAELGEKFRQAESKGVDHKTAGLMLGFPECCVDSFVQNFPKNYDPVPLIEVDGAGYPACNVMLRYFGIRIVSHFPCSLKCEETKKVGEVWLSVMEDIDKEAASWALDLLSAPMTWNSYHGVVEVDTPYFLGVTHTFPFLDKPRVVKWRGDQHG